MDPIHEDLLEGKGVAKKQRAHSASAHNCWLIWMLWLVRLDSCGERGDRHQKAHCNSNRGEGIIRNGDEVDRGCALAPVSGWVDGNTGIAQPRSRSPPVRMTFISLWVRCSWACRSRPELLGFWLWAGSLVSRPCPVDNASRRSLPPFFHCGGSSIKLPWDPHHPTVRDIQVP
jgi:hypothetical protein